MLKKLRAPFGVGVVFLVLSGCSDLTGPRLLTNFEWGEVEEPENIVVGVSTAVALGDLFILGQLNTSTRCYALDADFQRKGSKLTVLVRAESTNSPNCDESMGGFRYTATMINLKYDTYQLRVIHDIVGGVGTEYTRTVTIR
ncbi:MAG: hypothetical protein MUO50_05355 [Longimicrobiales bacterium]|nr:hypothetical protein [Longimicrobiales bacterium]